MKKIFSLFFNLLVIICYSQSPYEKGYNEYFNGDTRKSIEYFGESIEQKKDLANSYLYRGAAYLYLEQYELAISDLSVSMYLDSSNYKVYKYYGKACIFQERAELAIYYFDKGLLINNKDATTYSYRAMANLVLKRFDKAIVDYSSAIQCDSTVSDFYTNRGYLYYYLNKFEKAKKDYRKSISLGDALGHSNMGLLYYGIKDYKNAVKFFSSAIKLLPKEGNLNYFRGLSFQKMKRYNKACDDFEVAIKKGNKLAEIQFEKCH